MRDCVDYDGIPHVINTCTVKYQSLSLDSRAANELVVNSKRAIQAWPDRRRLRILFLTEYTLYHYIYMLKKNDTSFLSLINDQ